MKNLIVKKDFIDVSILKTFNDDLLNNLKVFLEKGTHVDINQFSLNKIIYDSSLS